MPYKNPDIVAAVAEWFAYYAATITGASLAMAIAFVRVIHGGGKVAQAIIGGIMCGLLSMALINGAGLLGLSDNYSLFVGGLVGFIGADTLRDAAIRLLGKKIDKWGL